MSVLLKANPIEIYDGTSLKNTIGIFTEDCDVNTKILNLSEAINYPTQVMIMEGTIVWYNNKLYKAKVDTPNDAPSDYSSNWERISIKSLSRKPNSGDIYGTDDYWNEFEDYAEGAYVIYNNKLYRSSRFSSGVEPIYEDYWDEISLKEMADNRFENLTWAVASEYASKVALNGNLQICKYNPKTREFCINLTFLSKEAFTISNGSNFLIIDDISSLNFIINAYIGFNSTVSYIGDRNKIRFPSTKSVSANSEISFVAHAVI